MSFYDDLPNEVIQYIFIFCNIKSLGQYRVLSKEIKKLIEDNALINQMKDIYSKKSLKQKIAFQSFILIININKLQNTELFIPRIYGRLLRSYNNKNLTKLKITENIEQKIHDYLQTFNQNFLDNPIIATNNLNQLNIKIDQYLGNNIKTLGNNLCGQTNFLLSTIGCGGFCMINTAGSVIFGALSGYFGGGWKIAFRILSIITGVSFALLSPIVVLSSLISILFAYDYCTTIKNKKDFLNIQEDIRNAQRDSFANNDEIKILIDDANQPDNKIEMYSSKFFQDPSQHITKPTEEQPLLEQEKKDKIQYDSVTHQTL